MKPNLIVTTVSVIALSLAALPAGAQARRPHDAGAREHGGGQAAAPQSAPAPRQESRPRAVPRQAPRAESAQDRPRGGNGQERAGAQDGNGQYRGRAVPRGDDRRAQAPAPGYYGQGRPQARGGYAVPRERGRVYGPTYNVRPSYRGRYIRPYNYVPYRPYYFGRPYYTFRPHFSLGFGLWLGYPVPYPYGYLGSYSPRVYGYYPDGGYSVSVYGGVSFDLRPMDADVFVDGQYVGVVGDFTPGAAPLTLTPGVHHIAVQADGYQPMEWDVSVQPGQVIPYRGDMQPY